MEITPKTPHFPFVTYLSFSTFSPIYGDELRQAMQGILPVTGHCITMVLEIKIFPFSTYKMRFLKQWLSLGFSCQRFLSRNYQRIILWSYLQLGSKPAHRNKPLFWTPSSDLLPILNKKPSFHWGCGSKLLPPSHPYLICFMFILYKPG